ncbi:MAG: biotin--[acetyl-CoA-carboxylase] ligase [Rubricoccaceae bacterium]|nr:biotin--[acetyl-CoA-carboxylase] ligase [Rubricoccaceae bacterium]
MSSSLPTELAALLRTKRFGRTIRWSESTHSTNTEALAWAGQGAPEGAVLGTDHQTAGKGRLGRKWTDSPGHNLLFSVLLRPTLVSDQLGLIPLAAGLAVAEAIKGQTNLNTALKWPNDVQIQNRKVCGILMEGQLSAAPESNKVMTLGIGLNVNQIEFAPEIAEYATSVALEVGRLMPRAPLLAEILLRFEQRYTQLLAGDDHTIRSDFEEKMTRLGDHASVHVANNTLPQSGRILGVDEYGALRLQTESGERRIYAGDVSLPASP